MIFQAPYPDIIYELYTPNPELNDSRKLLMSVNRKRTLSNTLVTYVRRNKLQQFNWQISFSLAKMWEVYYFLKEYGDSRIQVIDYKDRILQGHLLTSTHDFTHERMNDHPSALQDNLSGADVVVEELVTMQIDFIGNYQ